MKNFRVLLMTLTAMLALALQPALAATKLVDTTATGIGTDETEALADALAKAVSQVNGTSASLSVSTKQAALEDEQNLDKDGKKETGNAGPMARITPPDARMSASGSVASYEVVSTQKRADGKVEVVVKAKMKRFVQSAYKAPGSSKGKSRVAILEPDSEQGDYDFFGKVTAGQLTGDLWSSLESGVLESGHLSLLDRKTLKSSLDELHIVESQLAGEEEKAKLKNIRGADLILIPTIHKADHFVNESVVQLTGQVNRSEGTYVDVEVRGIVPATGEILLSKHYLVAEADGRQDALEQISADVTNDVSAVLAGRRPSPGGSISARSRHRPVVLDPEDLPLDGPRNNNGVRLPFDH